MKKKILRIINPSQRWFEKKSKPGVSFFKLVKSVTLIELLSTIVVMGLAVTVLMGYLGQMAQQEAYSEWLASSFIRAQEKMEQYRSFGFSDSRLVSSNDVSQGFSRIVSVNNVTLSGSDWVDTASDSDYKRVNVTVTKGTGPMAVNLSVSTLISNYTL